MIRLTRRQVRQIDRRAIEQYHIPGIVLMENAARGAADVAENTLRQTNGHSALILCGGGNNGGDGLAVARHLHNRGFETSIALCADPANYKGDALINWKIATAMALPRFHATTQTIQHHPADLIIDAIFGTGLAEAPREPFPAIVAAVRATQKPVLAIDLPSGLDCDTGHPLGPCIRAARTVTFVAEKVGFATPKASEFTGQVVVAEIGCPRELVEAVAHASPDSL